MYTAYLEVMTLLQGRVATKGYLRRRIAVTLSIFNFSSRFLAQIVENRRGHLSRPFLSTRDNFSKSYDETQIWAKWQRAGRADPWGLNPPARALPQGFLISCNIGG